jgi:hypothetical protein
MDGGTNPVAARGERGLAEAGDCLVFLTGYDVPGGHISSTAVQPDPDLILQDQWPGIASNITSRSRPYEAANGQQTLVGEELVLGQDAFRMAQHRSDA